ncbi:MAG: PAS domain S-box protein, partial [Chitinophagaceae bacterium]
MERYDILAKATSDTIWDWNLGHNTILYNPGITDTFGYDLDKNEVTLNWWLERLHPEDINTVMESFSEAIEKRTENIQQEYRFLCANGEYKFVLDRAYVLYDQHKNAVRMIGAMQDLSYAKEEENRMTKAIMDAQERERREIGLELHDNVNQILAGTLLSLGMINRVPAEQTPWLVEKSMTYINEAIQEIRTLSHQLAPANFNDISLEEIFRDLLESLSVQKEFTYSLHFARFHEAAISNDIQINLLRILQEQLNNIVKYAQATSVYVSVVCEGNRLTMRTYDDGSGFCYATVKKGIGLANIKKRAEADIIKTIQEKISADAKVKVNIKVETPEKPEIKG